MRDGCGFVVGGWRGIEGKMMLSRRVLWSCERWKVGLGGRKDRGLMMCEDELGKIPLAVPPKRMASTTSWRGLASSSAAAVRRMEDRERRMDSESDKWMRKEQRVVSYNVLSSSLCQSSRFSKCEVEDLEASTRLKRVLLKLGAEVERGSVICLQEVSMAWSGPLSDFFSENGYKFVLGISGNFINGYIGVGIAYPGEQFEKVEERVERIGNISNIQQNGNTDGEGKKTSTPRQDAWEKSEMDAATSASTTLRVWRVPGNSFAPARTLVLDEWAFARTRANMFVSVKLQERITKERFCFCTYHMPCAFFAPKVMVIHAALAAQTAHRLADGDPLIFAGKFPINFCTHIDDLHYLASFTIASVVQITLAELPSYCLHRQCHSRSTPSKSISSFCCSRPFSIHTTSF